MEAAVDAYADPWGEANDPVHPLQFAQVLVHPRAPGQVGGRDGREVLAEQAVAGEVR
jgi:hypothetical protein